MMAALTNRDDAARLAIVSTIRQLSAMRSVALRHLIALCLLQCATLTWAGEFSLARVTVVFSTPVPIRDEQFVRALSRAGGVTLSYVQPAAQDAHTSTASMDSRRSSPRKKFYNA